MIAEVQIQWLKTIAKIAEIVHVPVETTCKVWASARGRARSDSLNNPQVLAPCVALLRACLPLTVENLEESSSVCSDSLSENYTCGCDTHIFIDKMNMRMACRTGKCQENPARWQEPQGIPRRTMQCKMSIISPRWWLTIIGGNVSGCSHRYVWSIDFLLVAICLKSLLYNACFDLSTVGALTCLVKGLIMHKAGW